MNSLILLHGPPAAGKKTIGEQICNIDNNFRLLHNHISFDISKLFFDFGSEQFSRVNHQIKSGILETLILEKAFNIVMTMCYDPEYDLQNVTSIHHFALLNGYQPHYVKITCNTPALYNRVTNSTRIKYGKINNIKALKKALNTYSFSEDIILENGKNHVLDSGDLSAKENAVIILNNIYED